MKHYIKYKNGTIQTVDSELEEDVIKNQIGNEVEYITEDDFEKIQKKSELGEKPKHTKPQKTILQRLEELEERVAKLK